MSRSEQHVQEFYVNWLSTRRVLYCASAGGMRTSMSIAIRMKRAGYRKGFPDITICAARGGFHGMFAEVKCGTYPKPEQKSWQKALTAAGYYSIIVPGRFDFQESIDFLTNETEKYLNGEIQKP